MADDMLHITIGGTPVDTSTDVGFQPASAPAPAPDDVGFQPAPTPPKLPDTTPIVAQVQQNIAAQPAPADNAQPQTDAQKIDAGLGFQVTAALKGGDGTFPPAARAGLVQAYQNGTATTAGDYAQSVLPAAAYAATGGDGLSNALQRTGRDVIGAAGAVAAFIPDTVSRLIYAGAQSAGLIDKDVSIEQTQQQMGLPSIGESFNKVAEKLLPGGAPQNALAANVDKAATMTATMALGGAATLPVAAWRAVYLGAAGILGPDAQQAAVGWARSTFPDQPLLQEMISQTANFGTMLGLGVGGHAVEPFVHPGYEALKSVVAPVVGKPVDAVTPQDTNQVIDKTFTPQNPKAQDFHDVATVMNAQKPVSQFPQSKVVDEHGNPATVYHGTTAPLFDNFDNASGTHFFAFDPNDANNYTKGSQASGVPRVEMAKLDIQNPASKDEYNAAIDQAETELGASRGSIQDASDARLKRTREILQSKGYDGVLVKDDDGKSLYAIAFDKNQIAQNTLDTLHQTYAETGVHPDQVWEDAKNNPAIAADIQAGQVPDAYHDLRPAPPVEPEATTPAEAVPDSKLYQYPEEPQRLLQWIKQQGGVRDDGGDVANSIGSVKSLPGLIRNSGVEINELAQRAQEEGYTSPTSTDEAYKASASGQADLKNQLLDAIREDHNGQPQYRVQDANAVLDYNEAMKRNEEVDRISSDTGIPTDGETRKSFWNKVAEHESAEQQLVDTQSRAVETQKDYDDSVKAYLESRGEAFEANAEDRGQPATLEELDAERAKEIAARGDEAFPPRYEEPEPAAGTEGEGKEGGGRGGRGSEPPRGGGAGEPKEGPLTQPPALKDPRTFEDQLHQLSTNITADKLDIMKRAEAMPDLPSKTWEKLYAYDENDPNVKLTPKEQAIYDEHIKPLKDLDDKLYQRLEGLVGNVDLGEEEGFFQRGYTPRYVKGRTRSFGEMLEQAKNGVVAKFGGAAGRSMRKTVDAQKSRRYYNAFDPATGEKKLVYIDKEHNVIAFENGKGTKIGTFGAGQKLAPGSEVKLRALDENGKPVGKSFKWKLDTALTSEIEGQTNQRYLKNVAANRLDLTAKLQSAVRNAEFIEAMKGSPEFDDVAVPVGGHNSVIPETDGRAWRTPKMLQFRNYYMEPKLADALDDYAKNTQLDGIGESLNRVGRLMMNVMFLNPYAHISNIFNHMIVQGGLVGNIYHSPSTVMSLIKSFRDVYNVSDDYMANLRAGASLKHSEMLTSDLHQKLIEKLGIDAQKDPKAWDGLARAFGYNDTGTMLSRFASVGQRAMWFASDVMTNARMEQEQMLGKSRPEAIADVEKHMPNYRVPGQVLGSRTLAEGLKNPLWTMFGKYDYGRLKSYAALLKEGFGSGVSLTDRAKSFDRMAMIGVYMYAIYPALDKMWQEITGDKNASVVRSGAATIPQIASDLATGKKSVIDAAQAVMPTGIPIQLASDYMSGRYAWNGDPIINQSDVNNLRPQAAYDALNYVGSKLSYIGQAGNVMQNKGTASQMGYGLLGVKTPTDAQIKQRAYYKAREDTNAARRAGRLQQQRNNNR